MYHSDSNPAAELVPGQNYPFRTVEIYPNTIVEFYILALQGSISGAKIVWTTGAGDEDTNSVMIRVGPVTNNFHGQGLKTYEIWRGVIPFKPAGTTIYYRVQVFDGARVAWLKATGGDIKNALGQNVKNFDSSIQNNYSYKVVTEPVGTPTSTAVTPMATFTPMATATPTATPTLPVVSTPNVKFDDQNKVACYPEARWMTVQGTVYLPAEYPTANLQTNWYVVNPRDIKTQPYYKKTLGVTNGQRFSTQIYWPGIRPDDTVVENHIGAILLDSKTGNPIMSYGASLDYFWNAAYTDACPPPVKKVETMITGTVTISDGTPLKDIAVSLYRYDGQTWQVISQTTTNTSGHYQFTDLTADTFRVFFDDRTNTYQDEYYDDVKSFDKAVNITLTAGEIRTNVNAILGKVVPIIPTEITNVTGDVTIARKDDQIIIVTNDVWKDKLFFKITRRAVCTDDTKPTSAKLFVGSVAFNMDAVWGRDGVYEVWLTQTDHYFKNGFWYTKINGVEFKAESFDYDLVMDVTCSGKEEKKNIGRIVLVDPSGKVTDAVTGSLIEGATVTLYKVPGWRAQRADDITTGNLTSTCQSVATKNGSWNQPAPTTLGILPNPEVDELNGTQEISPSVVSQITGTNGRYSWDVVEGCWYVMVQAPGYNSAVSMVVGVPPEVTDLDVVLQPLSRETIIYLPLIVK